MHKTYLYLIKSLGLGEGLLLLKARAVLIQVSEGLGAMWKIN